MRLLNIQSSYRVITIVGFPEEARHPFQFVVRVFLVDFVQFNLRGPAHYGT